MRPRRAGVETLSKSLHTSKIVRFITTLKSKNGGKCREAKELTRASDETPASPKNFRWGLVSFRSRSQTPTSIALTILCIYYQSLQVGESDVDVIYSI